MELWKIVVALVLAFILGGLLGMKVFAQLLIFNAQLKLSPEQLKIFASYLLLIYKK